MSKSLTLEEYTDFVAKLASPKSTKDFNAKIGTGGLGAAGEAGEIADIAKKVQYHDMPFTEEVRQKLIKEAGDVLWYIAFLCRFVLEVSVQDVIDANVEKLSDRYKSLTFSSEEFMAKEAAKKDE